MSPLPILLLLLQPPGQWECKAYLYGDGVFTFDIAQSQPLEHFTNGLYVPHPSLASKVKRPDDGPARAEVHPVGRFAEFDVQDVFYLDRNRTRAKVVLVGRNGQYRPLLWLFHDGALNLSASEIVTVNEVEILMSRTREDGTGHFWLEDYFVFDPPLQKLVNLRVQERIQEELGRLLPAGHGVWKGGGFDIRTLTFSHSIWKEGNANCCPTGGSVTLNFRLSAGRLELAASSVEPAADSVSPPKPHPDHPGFTSTHLPPTTVGINRR